MHEQLQETLLTNKDISDSDNDLQVNRNLGFNDVTLTEKSAYYFCIAFLWKKVLRNKTNGLYIIVFQCNNCNYISIWLYVYRQCCFIAPYFFFYKKNYKKVVKKLKNKFKKYFFINQ